MVWRSLPGTESSRTTVHPAGAENPGSSSLLTMAASITCPAVVPAGRFSVMLFFADDEPLVVDATRVAPVAAGAGRTGPTIIATSPVAMTIDRRARRLGRDGRNIAALLPFQQAVRP